MQAKREYRDRDEDEVAVLDALVERSEEGMTVFEVRAAVDGVDIDRIEAALSALQADDLIRVEETDDGLRISPADRVVPDQDEGDDPTLIDAVRDRLGF